MDPPGEEGLGQSPTHPVEAAGKDGVQVSDTFCPCTGQKTLWGTREVVLNDCINSKCDHCYQRRIL